MLNGKITLEGGEVVEFKLPEQWNECTTKQIIELRATPNIKQYEVMEVFSGIPVDVWIEYTEERLMHFVRSMIGLHYPAPDWFSLPYSLSLEILDKKITLPNGVNEAPAGAVEALRSEIDIMSQQDEPNYEKLIPSCIALMAVKPFFGKYGKNGDDNARQLVPAIEAMPAEITYPLANFFFGASKKKQNIGRILSAAKQRKRNTKQGSVS